MLEEFPGKDGRLNINRFHSSLKLFNDENKGIYFSIFLRHKFTRMKRIEKEKTAIEFDKLESGRPMVTNLIDRRNQNLRRTATELHPDNFTSHLHP